MADRPDTGRPVAAGAPTASSTVLDPLVDPTVLVFHDVTSLSESLATDVRTDGRAVPPVDPVAPAPPSAVGPDGAEPSPPAPPVDLVAEKAPVEVVTDDERTRYGLLLDRAAERGLLDPAEYEIRLRELAEATTTARLVEIVTELPAFAAPVPTPRRSRTAVRPADRAGAAGAATGQRRRVSAWVLMALLVAVAVASLVILALSAERLSHGRSGSPPPAPAATRPVSALRL